MQLRKRDFLSFKNRIILAKNVDIFLIFAQNIDCGYTLEPPRRGGSNECPQSMFWSKNKKNRYTPAYPSFYYIKVEFKGVFIALTCFPDVQIFCFNNIYLFCLRATIIEPSKHIVTGITHKESVLVL